MMAASIRLVTFVVLCTPPTFRCHKNLLGGVFIKLNEKVCRLVDTHSCKRTFLHQWRIVNGRSSAGVCHYEYSISLYIHMCMYADTH